MRNKMKTDFSKAIDWIRKNWTKPAICPICSNDEWGIGDTLVEIKSSMPNSPIYPHLIVYCQRCGYTIFFNAVLSGIIKNKIGESEQ